MSGHVFYPVALETRLQWSNDWSLSLRPWATQLKQVQAMQHWKIAQQNLNAKITCICLQVLSSVWKGDVWIDLEFKKTRTNRVQFQKWRNVKTDLSCQTSLSWCQLASICSKSVRNDSWLLRKTVEPCENWFNLTLNINPYVGWSWFFSSFKAWFTADQFQWPSDFASWKLQRFTFS